MKPYNELSPFIRGKLDEFLEFAVPDNLPIEDVLTEQSYTRRLIRAAEGLLYRNKTGDSEKAITIIKWILSHQFKYRFHLITGSRKTGSWKITPDDSRIDPNWREFIGCELIIIYEYYRDRLPKNIVKLMKYGLILAALNSKRRNVTHYYTNVASMSAFLMEWVGLQFSMPNLAWMGIRKAYQIFKIYFKNHTFSEFNSPTYAGVTLISFNLWKKFGSPKMRKLGEILEKELWQNTAELYNANLRNITGPYIRAYGMNMLKYSSIIGLWIAVVLDNESLTPLPKEKDSKYFEISNIVPILHLEPELPNRVLQEFMEFTHDKFIHGKVLKRNEIFSPRMDFHAIIYENWMMGGLRRDRKNWNQRKIGTIHWKNDVDNIGWILIPGEGKTDVVITKTTMTLFAKKFASSIRFFIQGSQLKEHMFTNRKWKLPGIVFDVYPYMSEISVQKIENKDQFRIQWAIGDSVDSLFEITCRFPRKFRKQEVFTIEPIID